MTEVDFALAGKRKVASGIGASGRAIRFDRLEFNSAKRSGKLENHYKGEIAKFRGLRSIDEAGDAQVSLRYMS